MRCTRQHDKGECSRHARATGTIAGMDANEIQRQARNAVRKGSILDVDHK
ncbi:phage baseplate assembly protein V, partial [Burkholderia pseudomallei]